MWVSGLVVIVLILLSAGFAAISIANRVSDLDSMVDRSEPLATAAENLYAALSEADATAAVTFLSGGLESTADRTSYESAIANAAGSLATAASAAGSGAADKSALGQLSTGLPVYTGLVDTARAYNRLGLPVGAAYLREASGLMRATLLPAAQTLYEDQATVVVSTEQSVGAFPYLAVGLGVIILLALIVSQMVVSRATRRRLNLGYLVAVACTLGWVVWLSLSGIAASDHLADSRTQGSAPLGDLVQARILGQQGRADETLYLISQGSGDANEKDFGAHSSAMVEQLAATSATGDAAAAVSAASVAANRWITTHQGLVTASNNGDYAGAVKTGIGSNGTQFADLDVSLTTAIDDVRATLQDTADQARSSLSGLTEGIAILAVIAALAVAVGLWPRLREYQ